MVWAVVAAHNSLAAIETKVLGLQPLIDTIGMETMSTGQSAQTFVLFVFALADEAFQVAIVLFLAVVFHRCSILEGKYGQLGNVFLRHHGPAFRFDIANPFTQLQHGFVGHVALFILLDFFSVLFLGFALVLGKRCLESLPVLLR
jgi:hypothetical protein